MCTGIRLKASDGTVVHARTLEFAVDILSDLIVVPKGYKRVGSTPVIGKEHPLPGKKWTSKYASVGMSGLGLPVIFDGLNEEGLAIGLFFFPGFAEYMPYSPSQAENTIAPWEIGSWILENFKTVEQVKHEITKIVVPNVIYAKFDPDSPPPVHFVVHDASGKSIVIEYVGGNLNVHDNPLGVITNSPTFDWHLTNLRNYVNFSFTNAPVMKLGLVQLSPFGQGSGMLGIPGDFTPPSRFVRAVAYSQSVSEAFNQESSEGEYFHAATGEEAILQAFHILNNFDIPKGVARENEHIEAGSGKTFVPADYTMWTSASDLKAKQYYFRTYENSQIRMVDLTAHKDRSLKIARISIAGKENIQTVD
jgi:choloylglycine hydrolase